MSPILVWFRRDLRISDHTALGNALLSGRPILPVFIFSPKLIQEEAFGAPLTHFFFESVKSLAQNIAFLGGKLILRTGDFKAELAKLMAETGATTLYFNQDYEPDMVARDEAILHFFQQQNIAVKTFKDQVLFEKSEILNGSGQPYKVFTPYSKNWWAQLAQNPPTLLPRPLATSNWYKNDGLSSDEIPNLADFGLDISPYQLLVHPGEKAGRFALQAFLSKAPNYKTDRDIPSIEGTSFLSAHVRAGTISVRETFHHVEKLRQQTRDDSAREGYFTFLNELCWRDFYFQILHHFPQVIASDFNPNYAHVKWNLPDERFEAWKMGKTGYPIVDAAMRQLLLHGWMHNRLRMITASFLTKHLLIHWKHGERFFAHHLVDYDAAANNGGWQWSASTGTDAQPYFRVFNPTAQSEKFDANGDFIKRYCPELAKVPPKYIHEPSKMPLAVQEALGCVMGKDYPFPIVEHSLARQKAIDAFKNIE